jgi:hypothetical protein
MASLPSSAPGAGAQPSLALQLIELARAQGVQLPPEVLSHWLGSGQQQQPQPQQEHQLIYYELPSILPKYGNTTEDELRPHLLQLGRMIPAAAGDSSDGDDVNNETTVINKAKTVMKTLHGNLSNEVKRRVKSLGHGQFKAFYSVYGIPQDSPQLASGDDALNNFLGNYNELKKWVKLRSQLFATPWEFILHDAISFQLTITFCASKGASDHTMNSLAEWYLSRLTDKLSAPCRLGQTENQRQKHDLFQNITKAINSARRTQFKFHAFVTNCLEIIFGARASQLGRCSMTFSKDNKSVKRGDTFIEIDQRHNIKFYDEYRISRCIGQREKLEFVYLKSSGCLVDNLQETLQQESWGEGFGPSQRPPQVQIPQWRGGMVPSSQVPSLGEGFGPSQHPPQVQIPQWRGGMVPSSQVPSLGEGFGGGSIGGGTLRFGQQPIRQLLKNPNPPVDANTWIGSSINVSSESSSSSTADSTGGSRGLSVITDSFCLDNTGKEDVDEAIQSIWNEANEAQEAQDQALHSEGANEAQGKALEGAFEAQDQALDSEGAFEAQDQALDSEGMHFGEPKMLCFEEKKRSNAEAQPESIKKPRIAQTVANDDNSSSSSSKKQSAGEKSTSIQAVVSETANNEINMEDSSSSSSMMEKDKSRKKESAGKTRSRTSKSKTTENKSGGRSTTGSSNTNKVCAFCIYFYFLIQDFESID